MIINVDNGSTAAEIIKQQEAAAVAELDKKINGITCAAQITLDECPTTELDPEFERCAVQRVVNEEEILSVLENDEEDEEGGGHDGGDDVDASVPARPKYTSAEKLEYVTRFLHIIDQEEELNNKIIEALPEIEIIRKRLYQASNAKQTTLTQFFRQQ